MLAQIIAPRIIVPTMDGVTTAIVGFLFICLVMPQFVKNKTQYYAALVSALVIIFLHALAVVLNGTGFVMFAAFATGILQISAIVMLVLCSGGMTMRQFGGELVNAYEVIRRGEEEKEIIVPLRGQQPLSKEDRGSASPAGDAPPVHHINNPAAAPMPPSATPPPPQQPQPNSSIPLE